MVFEYNYKISFIDFKIIANIDLKEFIEPQPYSLYINYNIEDAKRKEIYKIIIENNTEINDIKIDYKEKELKIFGNIKKILKNDYNKQFSLFGNKGIINRFILHIIEKDFNAIALHGCAVKHPKTNKVIIGIGPSGSGKSTFISTALKNGWKLIATEHVIIDEDFNIYKGNVYDNISPYALDFISENLKETKIYNDKKLIEPLAHKIFINYQNYAISEEKIKLELDNTNIIILNFKKEGSNSIELNDKDFLLRMLQISASEKITFPLIYCDLILDNDEFNGNVKIRNKVIDNIIESKINKSILSGNYEDFENYVKEQLKS